MSKKKDTLKDLNEFMRQQSPANTSGEDFMKQQPTSLAAVENIESEVQKLDQLPAGDLQEAAIAALISKAAKAAHLSNRQLLFNIIDEVITKQEKTDSIDIMLLNQVMFLRQHDLLISKLDQ